MRSPRAVGVVVPIHDEEELLPACLDALAVALAAPAVAAIPAQVALVLDDCADGSYAAAEAFLHRVGLTGPDHLASIVRISAANVGLARAAGCDAILSSPPSDPETVWMATTDADSRVPAHWLSHQLHEFENGTDAWAGTVTVDDWSGRRPATGPRYSIDYATAPFGHVHGTNLGFTAATYLAAGGFPPLATGEDRAFWVAAGRAGRTAVHDRRCPVVTSARRRGRAPHGFAHLLNDLEAG